MAIGGQSEPSVRLAEVVSCLSLASDLATGQPLEHGLRRCLLATWLGEELGLGATDLSDAYYVALLGSVGCTIEAAMFAKYARDDIALSSRAATVDPSSRLELVAFGLRNFGAGEPLPRRLGKVMSAALSGPGEFQAVCRDVALGVGDMLEIGPTIRQALAQCHERWNGRGAPKRLKREDILLPARIFHIVHDAEIVNRFAGVEGVAALARRRAGNQYDPHAAGRFCDIARSLFTRLESEPTWDAVLVAEPAPARWLSPPDVDAMCEAIAKFVDLRIPHTAGHSTGVARLAEDTARTLGLPDMDVVTLRRAGLLQDLGAAGIPVALWNKHGTWTASEWERAKRHPALTELVLARSSSLSHLGTLAGLHHERLDGSGYRGMTAMSLPLAARILAAVDTYRTKLEPRPHRPALNAEGAADEIHRLAERGQLDSDVAEALGVAAGHQRPRRVRDAPAGLSEREVEVLRLVTRGLSNRQIGRVLSITPKTVGHHVQHIYDKLGVSTRVGATLFAVRYGLADDVR